MRDKNLTAKIAEHAEIKKAKGLRPGDKRTSIPIFSASRQAIIGKLLSRNDLCVLCLLFGHPPVFIRKGYREKKISISQKEKRSTNRRDTGARREDEI